MIALVAPVCLMASVAELTSRAIVVQVSRPESAATKLVVKFI